MNNIHAIYGDSSISFAEPTSPIVIKKIEENLEQAPIAKKYRTRILNGFANIRYDDYYWLANKENPVTLQFLHEWNHYSAKQLEPLQDFSETLYQEIISRMEPSSQSVPFQVGNFFYYERMEEGKEYPIYCRTAKEKNTEEVILDGNSWGENEVYFKIKSFEPSPDGRFVAFMIDSDGSQFGKIHIKDMTSGQFLKEEIIEQSNGMLAWNSRSDGLWYAHVNEELRTNKVSYHKLGSNVEADLLVHEERNGLYNLKISKDKLDRFIAIESYSKDTSEIWVGCLDDSSHPLSIVHQREKGLMYSIIFGDQHHYLMVSKNRSNWSLCSVKHGEWSDWNEVIPPKPSLDIVCVEAFESYLAIILRENGLLKINVMNLLTNEINPVHLPQQICQLRFSHNKGFQTNKLRFTFESPITPESTYEYNMETQTLELLMKKKAGSFNSDLYQTEKIEAVAIDGTKIPLSLCYQKGLKRDGCNPLYLYAYGAYGITKDPCFNTILASFLERGVVCAIAHVRGGGDLGREWYNAGCVLNKMNTFTDFIRCSEHLINQGYTSSDRLAIHGASAGGLLMGAVVNMRPDLFKVCFAAVPFVDVLTSMLDESIPLTIEEYEEWGNPNLYEHYKYMARYSPYDNIRAQNYPAMLVTAGINDAQVLFHEPAKFVAKLREFNTSKAPLLFKTSMDAGHHGSSGRYKAYKDIAANYAFILDQIGVTMSIN